MKISPINININNDKNQNFRAKILETKFLTEGFNLAKKSAESGQVKQIKFARDFYEAIQKVNDTLKYDYVIFDIDKNTKEFYASDGYNKLVTNTFTPNWQAGYQAIQIVKKLADNLNSQKEKNEFDVFEENIKKAEENYYRLKTKYGEFLKTKLDDLKKTIS